MDKARVVYTDGDEEFIYFEDHDFSEDYEYNFLSCYVPEASGNNIYYRKVDSIRVRRAKVRTLYLYDTPILPLQLQRELEEPEPVDHFEDVEEEFI